ncbi:HD domain-containing protein [Syncephalis pseudoplumigaleata]|uniref:5'-deoxynucleotidase n=1 Tax=Syncephalis pseudoplumigaleata TaxID=1712513 RepID=A0A4P9YZV0_9FUNG|nr:HD domain-containing protein [Syncephalis pseudoplumigaleata]|eukprot:RKP25495.1 HD domain-containing protein [Syncephalis pseudoplumigaleata]
MRALEFFHLCENLKRTKRTGWVEHGIQQPESIADHMHRMALMAMLVDDPSINRERCVKMAIVHDLAEAIVGDITPHAGVSKEEKHRMEQDAMERIRDMLGNTEQANEIYALWQEYEEARTDEALFVKDLDKYEMIVQALEYEKGKRASMAMPRLMRASTAQGATLDSFFDSTLGRFQHPLVRGWVNELMQERAQK